MTEWVSMLEAARRSGIDVRVIRRLVRAKVIPARKVVLNVCGPMWQIDPDDVPPAADAFMLLAEHSHGKGAPLDAVAGRELAELHHRGLYGFITRPADYRLRNDPRRLPLVVAIANGEDVRGYEAPPKRPDFKKVETETDLRIYLRPPPLPRKASPAERKAGLMDFARREGRKWKEREAERAQREADRQARLWVYEI